MSGQIVKISSIFLKLKNPNKIKQNRFHLMTFKYFLIFISACITK